MVWKTPIPSWGQGEFEIKRTGAARWEIIRSCKVLLITIGSLAVAWNDLWKLEGCQFQSNIISKGNVFSIIYLKIFFFLLLFCIRGELSSYHPKSYREMYFGLIYNRVLPGYLSSQNFFSLWFKNGKHYFNPDLAIKAPTVTVQWSKVEMIHCQNHKS